MAVVMQIGCVKIHDDCYINRTPEEKQASRENMFKIANEIMLNAEIRRLEAEMNAEMNKED